MAVFFSGTDNEELAENAPNYEYYLSLIVNNKGDMMAKVAFMGEQEINTPSFTFKGLKGKKHIIKGEKKVEPSVFTIDMDIYYLLDGVFLEQTEEIMKKPAPTFTSTYTAPHVNQTNHNHNTTPSSGKVFDIDAKKFLGKWIPQDMGKTAAFNASLWYDLSSAGRKYSTPEEQEAYREALVNTYDEFAEKIFATDKGVIAKGKSELLERCINIINREGGSLAITKTIIQALKDSIAIEKMVGEWGNEVVLDSAKEAPDGQLKITGPGGQSI